MSYTPKNNFNLKMIKIGDTIPIYTPENNSNFQLKRTDVGEVGFRKKLLKDVACCDKTDYQFKFDFNPDSVSVSGGIVINILEGCANFTWEITGTDFTLDEVTTSVRYNIVRAGVETAVGTTETLTVTDSCRTVIETTIICCDANVCCDLPGYAFTYSGDDPLVLMIDTSKELTLVGGCPPYLWTSDHDNINFSDPRYTNTPNNYVTATSGSEDATGTLTIKDDCDTIIEIGYGELEKKILIGGGFYYINSILTYRMALLNIRGVLDETFLPYPNGYVYTMAVRSDNKIWIGGTFSRLTTEEIRRYRLARINTDGSVDLDFNLNVSNFVERVVIQSDEKLLICGGFISVGGINRNHIARFNTDDTLDMDFDPNADAEVRRMTLQGDKILISGNFETVGGTAKVAMARLNSNGTLDESFTTPVFTGSGGGVTYPNAIKILSNGQILIGGAFLSVNGVARRGLARLSADGILDEAFNANLDNGVTTITLLDNEILITGLFTDIGGVVRNKIAKLELNGDLIIAYDPNVDGQVINTVIELPDKRIMIGGVFTSVGGTSVSNITLLKVDGTLDVNFTPEVGSPVYTVQLFTSE